MGSKRYTADEILEALRRWAAEHDGLAPSRRDWSRERDPDHHWPRAETVAATFGAIAHDKARAADHAGRCPQCTCQCYAPVAQEVRDAIDQAVADVLAHHRAPASSRDVAGVTVQYGTWCECYDCQRRCPTRWHEQNQTPGWLHALELAGLAPRRGSDELATAAGPRPGRNRQTVTGGQGVGQRGSGTLDPNRVDVIDARRR